MEGGDELEGTFNEGEGACGSAVGIHPIGVQVAPLGGDSHCARRGAVRARKRAGCGGVHPVSTASEGQGSVMNQRIEPTTRKGEER